MSEKVSIVIPFYNCPYINEAVESALSQTYKNIEIIVVDDGSTKHSELLLPYMGSIKYIKKENGGTASAVNRGIREATGDYFCWLSSDDKFHPRKVERQLSLMQERGAAASFMSFYLIDEHSKVVSSAIHFPFVNKLLFYKRLKSGCPINGCTVMIKMEVFDKIGSFNESLLYTQDYDYWLRLVQQYDFEYFDEALLYYRVHSDMGTKKYSAQQKQEIDKLKKQYASSLRALIKKEITSMSAADPKKWR